MGSSLNLLGIVIFPPCRGRVFNTSSKQMIRHGAFNPYYNRIMGNYTATAAESTTNAARFFSRPAFFPIKKQNSVQKCQTLQADNTLTELSRLTV